MERDNIAYINKNKMHGDIAATAEIVGCDISTVDKMLRGVRNSDTELGKRVVLAMASLIDTRKRIKRSKVK